MNHSYMIGSVYGRLNGPGRKMYDQKIDLIAVMSNEATTEA